MVREKKKKHMSLAFMELTVLRRRQVLIKITLIYIKLLQWYGPERAVNV